MIKLQQFTFVCAPQPVQWAGVVACDIEFPERVAEYRLNRDFLLHELGNLYEFAPADGAFYLFGKAPWGTGTEFVAEAIKNDLLIIPGNVFSDRDTHFRISYAGEHRTLERGVEVLRKLAKR
jgi:aspartate aminotransferase/aminotransferase